MDGNNGSHQYLDNEVTLKTTELEDETKHDAKVDFVDDKVSVQSEICRGNKLRNEKPRHNETVLSTASLGPYVKQRSVRKSHLKSLNINKRQNTYKCPCTRPISAASTYTSYSRISRIDLDPTKSKRCPLRIAELAVPSKRRCLGTWRDKNNVLPGFMVERLKQQVMDQIPIAKVPEAVYCFQNQKRVTSKNSTFRWLTSKQVKHQVQKPTCQMDIRMLCILFGHKVSQRLSKSLKLTLKADLVKLTQIVCNDIAKLMYVSANRISQDDMAILVDISNKVTFWITGILEESYIKTLEDDLRDLEEEEGPVLDLLDDVINNVMNVCEPQLPHSDSNISFSSDSMQHSVLPEESEESFDLGDSQMEKFDEEPTPDSTAKADDALIDSSKDFSDSEYFQNEISKIINNITKESEDLMDNAENEDITLISKIKHDINYGTQEEVSPIEEMEHDIDIPTNDTEISLDVGIQQDITDGIQQDIIDGIQQDITDGIQQDITDGIQQDITDGIQQDITDGIQQDVTDGTQQDITDGIQQDISDGLQQDITDGIQQDITDGIQQDISDGIQQDITDGNNEEVPNVEEIDHVNENNLDEKVENSTTEEQNQNKPTPWISYSKPNIIFAEPNQDLLSDADETWPADFGDKPMLKVTDSVSKSITSLGIINEHNENIIMQPQQEEDENSVVNKETVDLDALNKILDSMLSKGKHDTATKLDATDPATKQLRPTSQDEADVKHKTNSTTFTKTNHESVKLKTIEIDSDERDQETSTVDANEDDKIRSKIKLDWKVHLQTAPAWVHEWEQGRGEPSEDSIPVKKKPTKVTDNEMRMWCKDLEKAFVNLEFWSNWISATCRESLFIMKQKKLTCPCLAKRGAMNWRSLKRKVHKDTLLWTKLYQRADKKFKMLKRKYNNVQIVATEYCALCTKTDHLNRMPRLQYNTQSSCLNNKNKN
ncbi:hypothetical protein PYW08_006826 [Mythimna loreyi]|uniref:Uncharacterized protein n=1 Tax=Mythimna loreyi TaxID=667449 RepID=A0ACC2R801_9NEOP|nr:hypothetical protein PYW08_006826 [Mythimna loreyi]